MKNVAAVTGAVGSSAAANAAAAEGEDSVFDGDDGPAAAEVGDDDDDDDDEEETSRAVFFASAAPPPVDRRPALVRFEPRDAMFLLVSVRGAASDGPVGFEFRLPASPAAPAGGVQSVGVRRRLRS